MITRHKLDLKVRAANSLLSITHSMKLLLLLSDEAQIAHMRDAELKTVQEEKENAREQVAALLDELIRRPDESAPVDVKAGSSR